ncbi:MAG: hypothetical protein DI533_04710 [Cereibacter sphaeroides]|uniref:Uncharacterized protein n=1 Tax=Cereibacter sphaeroides TaxID=1063 RepID=A0A2W5SJU5_CERSP|nr:MAG: hypothetical protein DI533_04710 [Cereibacter sphaeroides]
MALVITYLDGQQTVVVRPSPEWTQSLSALAERIGLLPGTFQIVDEATVEPTEEDLLRARRSTLNPFARAFFEGLKYFPAEGFLHTLDRYTNAVALLRQSDPYHPLVVWDQRIVQIIRLNPDMDVFAASFGVSPLVVDAMCEVGLVLESDMTPEGKGAAIQAILEALA